MQAKFKLLITILIVLFLLTTCQTTKIEPIPGDKIGILLMHGGFGGTQYYSRGLGSKLKRTDILVTMPIMPWGKNRAIDKSYEETMDEIDIYVAQLKKTGAKRIVIAGHSLGANASLGYASRRRGLSGVILLAYGHLLGIPGYFAKNLRLVAKAEAMIKAGEGENSASFMASGGSRISGTADDIFSWFDPQGPATIRYNAPRVDPDTPVFCTDGSADFGDRCNRIRSWLPKNPDNYFPLIEADHLNTPIAAFEEIIEWLRKL